MAINLKIPSKTGNDNFNLQDFIDDLTALKTNLESALAGTGIADKGILKAKLEQSIQDTLGQVATNTNSISSQGTLITQAMPSGAVLPFAMSNAPSGWLKCNGQVVSRVTYASLFSAIGTTFGAGDGSTTFKLPDLRGEFIRGVDDTRGVDTGRTLGSAQADDFKAHTHSQQLGGTLTTVTPNAGTGIIGNANNSNVSSTGGTETRPRNIALLYCIKI